VQVAGDYLPVPRCSHVSFTYGSQLIVFGGKSLGFYILKDINIIELD
jgi:hypothetical protein